MTPQQHTVNATAPLHMQRHTIPIQAAMLRKDIDDSAIASSGIGVASCKILVYHQQHGAHLSYSGLEATTTRHLPHNNDINERTTTMIHQKHDTITLRHLQDINNNEPTTAPRHRQHYTAIDYDTASKTLHGNQQQ